MPLVRVGLGSWSGVGVGPRVALRLTLTSAPTLALAPTLLTRSPSIAVPPSSACCCGGGALRCLSPLRAVLAAAAPSTRSATSRRAHARVSSSLGSSCCAWLARARGGLGVRLVRGRARVRARNRVDLGLGKGWGLSSCCAACCCAACCRVVARAAAVVAPAPAPRPTALLAFLSG